MSFPHRTFCDALHEARDILKTISIWNFKRVASHLKSLHEEIQTYGNRMESALSYEADIDRLHKKKRKLEQQVRELKSQLPKNENKDVADTRVSFRQLLEDDEDA